MPNSLSRLATLLISTLLASSVLLAESPEQRDGETPVSEPYSLSANPDSISTKIKNAFYSGDYYRASVIINEIMAARDSGKVIHPPLYREALRYDAVIRAYAAEDSIAILQYNRFKTEIAQFSSLSLKDTIDFLLVGAEIDIERGALRQSIDSLGRVIALIEGKDSTLLKQEFIAKINRAHATILLHLEVNGDIEEVGDFPQESQDALRDAILTLEKFVFERQRLLADTSLHWTYRDVFYSAYYLTNGLSSHGMERWMKSDWTYHEYNLNRLFEVMQYALSELKKSPIDYGRLEYLYRWLRCRNRRYSHNPEEATHEIDSLILADYDYLLSDKHKYYRDFPEVFSERIAFIKIIIQAFVQDPDYPEKQAKDIRDNGLVYGYELFIDPFKRGLLERRLPPPHGWVPALENQLNNAKKELDETREEIRSERRTIFMGSLVLVISFFVAFYYLVRKSVERRNKKNSLEAEKEIELQLIKSQNDTLRKGIEELEALRAKQKVELETLTDRYELSQEEVAARERELDHRLVNQLLVIRHLITDEARNGGDAERLMSRSVATIDDAINLHRLLSENHQHTKIPLVSYLKKLFEVISQAVDLPIDYSFKDYGAGKRLSANLAKDIGLLTLELAFQFRELPVKSMNLDVNNEATGLTLYFDLTGLDYQNIPPNCILRDLDCSLTPSNRKVALILRKHRGELTVQGQEPGQTPQLIFTFKY